MQLRVSQLLSELSAVFPGMKSHIEREDLVLERPLIYTKEISLDSNRVYLCEAKLLSYLLRPVNEQVLMLVIGELADSLVSVFLNICTFPIGTELSSLLNTVQELFDRYDSWDAAMRTSLESDADLNELLNVAASVLKNPLMVCSADYSILARSNTIEDRGELLGSHVSYKLIQKLKMNTAFQKHTAERLPFRYHESTSGTEVLCQNLYAGNEFVNRIIVANTERPFIQYSEILLESIAEYVQRAFSNNRFTRALYVTESRFSRAEALLIAAISNEKVDYIPIINGMTDISWQQTHRYCCVCVKIGSLDYREHTIKVLCNQLEELLAGSCAFEFAGNIVVMINLNLYGGSAGDVMSQAVYYLRDNFLKAGVSNEFTGFFDMYYHHRQAVIALDFVCRQQSHRWIARFSDVALPYMAEQCMQELPMHVACSQGILSMQRYDEEHGTFFYQTLASYIHNRFNALRTAKTLFIHRSTFLYRMERMKELFRIDLENDDMLLYAMLSMKMLELSRSLKTLSELPYGKEP